MRLTYRPNKPSPPVSFIGVLLAIRRNPGDPTIVVRGVVDDITIDQVFCIFSPLLESIEVLKAIEKRSERKLYSLPTDKIIELQKSVQRQIADSKQGTKRLSK